jgi:hypothetical protein
MSGSYRWRAESPTFTGPERDQRARAMRDLRDQLVGLQATRDGGEPYRWALFAFELASTGSARDPRGGHWKLVKVYKAAER